eukprot:CAMPEP_0201481252 /NCGR_PEP_ID=MMETSP0151_2-20130828/5539_1 /ASSEMBLY_ACC=CAM_ASM_000257 /TAXON_ID=200890 /ORGANISM="Paramoeba atlantica, Strain 621/1 / CCAP 1560/9" /LENGTH=218 /DNA_ID=CAMNT_0047863351 /DNA_START=90 /DNA_END=746 /DNA_ORIENTATION=-
MIVICLEGCHGSGKTQLCAQFASAGYNVLDEAFMDMPSTRLHPQSFTMESIWVCRWTERLLKKQEELGSSEKTTIFFADRSPYSAVFYSRKNGAHLEPVIQQHFEDLKKVGIYTYTVYLRVPDELLWSRILQRLKAEPHRLKYNENSREWMEQTVSFYEKMDSLWDFIFENSQPTLQELMKALFNYLTERLADFEHLSREVTSHSGKNLLPLVQAVNV